MRRSRIDGLAARAVALSTALALGGLASCGGEEADPVARLVVEPMEITLPYGSFAELQLSWSLRAEPEGAEGAPRVFLHLLDSDGDLARTFDHELPGDWRPGTERSYSRRIYQSLLAPPLPAGRYTLTAGLYDVEGNRWPLAFKGEEVGRHEYRVATVEVPTPQAAALPTVRFSPSWSPTLAGTDRQVVAYRWLTGSGAIQLDEIPEAGTLWLALRVPDERSGDMTRRIVDPPEGGDGMARVGVAVGCSDFRSQVSGEGAHEVDASVPAGEGPCEVTLEPNFRLESVGAESRSVLLEVLAWRAGGK